MKKTLIALMAFAGLASAQSFNLDSKVINGENTFSAFDSVVGFTKAEAAANTGLNVDRYNQPTPTVSVTLGDLYGYTEGTTYQVETITFAMRYDTAANIESTVLPTTSSLTLKVGDTIYGTTGNAVFSYDTAATNENSAIIGSYTFTFSEAVVLTGTEGTLTLAMTSSGSEKGLSFLALKDKDTVIDAGTAAVVNGFGPVVRISGQIIPAPSVPEPATATLSLLALAGLAARRRRH